MNIVIFFFVGLMSGGITIEPSTFIQGQSASITCSDPGLVRIRKSKNSIINCNSTRNTPDCLIATCFIDEQTCTEQFFTQYYSYSKRGNNVTVNIGNVSKERDDGTWSCLESNGIITFTTIDVKVPVQSVTIQQKNNLILINGRRTSINCTTGVSYPPATITWSIGGTNINGGTTTNNPDNTTTSILQYTPDKTDHNIILRCSATNGLGSTKSDSITLNIRYSPVVHIIPPNSPYKVIKGKQLNLTCIVDEANPSPDQSTGFTWSKDGVTIPGQMSSVYRVESVERSHTGSYTCTGDNGVGTGTSTPVQVDVLFPPSVSTPSVYKAVELTDISLQCTATANPGDITYRWTGPGNLNTTGPWLNISNISKDRSGTYTCTATNLMVPTSSSSETGRGQNTTDIDVLFGPTVTLSPTTSSVKIQENTNLLLTCTVQSNPLPTSIKWYKPDGTSDNLSSDGQLVITSIKRNQAGLYRCEANMTLEPSNGGVISRSDSKTVDITVQAVPVPPSNITYSQVGTDRICVDWRAGFNGGDPQKFIVQHSTDDKRWTESTPISSSSYCIENLQPDTLYYIRVVARNRYGDSQPVYVQPPGYGSLLTAKYDRDNGAVIGLGVGLSIAVIVAVGLLVYNIHLHRKLSTSAGASETTTRSTNPPDITDRTGVRSEYASLEMTTRTNQESDGTYSGLKVYENLRS